jgi:hypothetical protein
MRGFVAVSVLVLLIPSVAWADPSDVDRGTARALAREGYEAQKHGHFDVAADRFQRAEALVHAPTLLLGLARAQTGLGKLVEAHENYERILREPLSPSAPGAFAKAVDDARRESDALTERLAWVTLDIHGPPAPEVLVDDVPVPAVAIGVKRPYDPGHHTVKASAPGYVPMERVLAADEGTTQTLTLSMVPLPAVVATSDMQPQADVATTTPPAAESSPASFRTTFAIVAVGVGVTGLAVGSVTGVLALTKHASLSADCPNGHCASDKGNDVETYRTFANVSTVAMIVGAAGAATGITLLLTAPKSTSMTAYAGFLRAGVEGTF